VCLQLESSQALPDPGRHKGYLVVSKGDPALLVDQFAQNLEDFLVHGMSHSSGDCVNNGNLVRCHQSVCIEQHDDPLPDPANTQDDVHIHFCSD